MLLTVSQAWAVDYTYDKDENRARPHYVGEVRHFRGKAFRLSEGKRKLVAEGTQFYKDDALITEERSIAKLSLVDETILTVGPNSEIKFENFEFKSKTDRRIHSFIRGQLTGHVKNKAAAGDITVRTPNAVMGVRGTQFLVNHRSVKGLEISEYALLEGSVEVTDDKNKVHTLGKADKIVVVRDPKRGESGSQSSQLSAEELRSLESDHKDFGPEFRPFLPFFDPRNVDASSGLFVFLDPLRASSSAGTSAPSDQAKAEPKDSGSFDNLQKLNEQLKKNKRK